MDPTNVYDARKLAASASYSKEDKLLKAIDDLYHASQTLDLVVFKKFISFDELEANYGTSLQRMFEVVTGNLDNTDYQERLYPFFSATNSLNSLLVIDPSVKYKSTDKLTRQDFVPALTVYSEDTLRDIPQIIVSAVHDTFDMHPDGKNLLYRQFVNHFDALQSS